MAGVKLQYHDDVALTGRGLFFGMSDRREQAGDEGEGARDGHGCS